MDRRHFVTGLGAAMALAAMPKAHAVEFYETTALVDNLIPVTLGSDMQWRWIHRLQLPALKAGDVLQVAADGEIRNNTGINMEIATAVTLTPGWPYYVEDLSGYGGVPGFADFIVRVAGENVDAQRHYLRPTLKQNYLVPVDLPPYWLHFRGRARSDLANTGTHTASIMGPGYGKLSCVIHRAS